MIADKHFKLSKQAKTRVALSGLDAVRSNQFKNMLIQSELYEIYARKAALKSKEKNKDLD